ncbi:hypothetical protein HY797_00320 [Candidatus Falkowbacteria bacterium]|nr:hypothetical protein [Candidatus Falkowbacteria bacterium]
MKKKLFIAGFIMIALSFVFISGVRGKASSRINGDVVQYKGVVYLATVNSGAVELHEITNTKITKVATINSVAGNSGCQGFIDAALNIEERGIFLFLTDGKYVYKYDINDSGRPMLFKKSNDSANGRFIGLGKIDNNVYSVSDQGIKVWNDEMDVSYSVNFNNSFAHNIKFSKQGSFIFNIKGDQLEIYDASSQKLMDGWASGLKVVRDGYGEKIVVFDNYNITVLNQDFKKIGSIRLDNNEPLCLIGENLSLNLDYNHAVAGSEVALSGRGYGSGENLLIYLNNKKIDSVYADNSGRFLKSIIVPQFNANTPEFRPGRMDIKVLGESSGKSYSINFQIEESGTADSARSVNKKHGLPGEEVALSGSGFNPGEYLLIYFADKKIDSVYADSLGSFAKVIVIPDIKPGKYEIKISPQFGNGYIIKFEVDYNYENIFHRTERHTGEIWRGGKTR